MGPRNGEICWPICRVTLAESVRILVLLHPAPPSALERLFRRANTVNVSHQFIQKTGILEAQPTLRGPTHQLGQWSRNEGPIHVTRIHARRIRTSASFVTEPETGG